MVMSQIEQNAHDVLPKTNHDELARQQFVRSFKEHIVSNIHPGLRTTYEHRAKKRFEAANGASPTDKNDVASVMKPDPYYRMFSSLLRTSQEMMWSSVQLPVARSINELASSAAQADPIGSLRLDPDLPLPKYHSAVDIHCQPGGYHTEYIDGDVAQGAMYDRAVYIYAMGQMGQDNADMGDSVIAWIKNNYPDFSPKRILDMGCSVGHSTLPYTDAWPDAEVHAIDVAAPMLRYAHARAESKGKAVHFSQQNAEKTDFEDGSFDLVVSHILMHETSDKAVKNVMAECNRLLAPGGLMAHAETPPYEGMEPFDAFMLDWDSTNNNEPFWRRSHELDLPKLTTDAGFNPEKMFSVMAPSAYQIADAERSGTFQGGDFGGGGVWFIYGCEKA